MTDDEKYADIVDAVAKMGRASRWWQRRIARRCGLTVAPGYSITVVHQGRREVMTRPDEDLLIWEDGEREYNLDLDKHEGLTDGT